MLLSTNRGPIPLVLTRAAALCTVQSFLHLGRVSNVGGVAGLIICECMTRDAVLTDEQWARIEPLLPPVEGRDGPAVP